MNQPHSHEHWFRMEQESEQLRRAWSQYPAEFLDNYLVQGVENPCVNPQSVTVRHLMIDTLAPGRFNEQMQQERLYAACACQTLLAANENELNAFTAALDGERNADLKYPLPKFLKDLRDGKTAAPFTAGAVWRQVFQAMRGSFAGFESPFEQVWREQLAAIEKNRITILEAACGSANDYRYFERYGLARAVDYTGIDICPANITNAQRRCPRGKFLEGNALQLPFADKSFDFYLVFDLFEHLSPEAFQLAIKEAARVARRRLWLSFFRLDWKAEHEIVPEPPYYRNILSIPRILETLAGLGCEANVIDIPSEWQREFPGYRHYNATARVIEAQLPS